ncbi:hypothetical protein K474DRAFT_1681042, partial [Panus rudis PR-1116 ss-1]
MYRGREDESEPKIGWVYTGRKKDRRHIAILEDVALSLPRDSKLITTTVYYHACLRIRKNDPMLETVNFFQLSDASINKLKKRILSTPDGPTHEESVDAVFKKIKKIVPSPIYRCRVYEILERQMNAARKRVEENLHRLQGLQKAAYISEQIQGALQETREAVRYRFNIDLEPALGQSDVENAAA